jgi:hypothetical protein
MKKNFENLTPDELWKLRNEIVLNSMFYSDFTNKFGFDMQHISQFFDGYVEYLNELAEEDGYVDWENMSEMLNKYDNKENLLGWFNSYDDLSGIKFDNGLRIGDNVKWYHWRDLTNKDESLENKIFEVIEIKNSDEVTIREINGNVEELAYADELDLIEK